MASQNFYVKEYKAYLWNDGLVVDVVCVCVYAQTFHKS
jgi:hypothetical protein